jgi:hypothetical protein
MRVDFDLGFRVRRVVSHGCERLPHPSFTEKLGSAVVTSSANARPSLGIILPTCISTCRLHYPLAESNFEAAASHPSHIHIHYASAGMHV